MRFDIQNQLSVAQGFTGATTVSTNSYQLQTYNDAYGTVFIQDPSIGRRMSILGMVTVAAGAGSSHTNSLITASNSALTSNVTVVATSGVSAAATLVAGYAFEIMAPNKSISQQFIGFQNGSTGGTTTITLDVYWVPSDEIPAYKAFPKVVDADV